MSTYAYVATAKVSRKGWVVIPAVLRVRRSIMATGSVSVADADGQLYVFPALRDPVRDSRGMLAGKPDLTRLLLEERAAERGRE